MENIPLNKASSCISTKTETEKIILKINKFKEDEKENLSLKIGKFLESIVKDLENVSKPEKPIDTEQELEMLARIGFIMSFL